MLVLVYYVLITLLLCPWVVQRAVTRLFVVVSYFRGQIYLYL